MRSDYDAFAHRIRPASAPRTEPAREVGTRAERSAGGGSVVRPVASTGGLSPATDMARRQHATESADSLSRDLSETLRQVNQGVPLNRVRAIEPGRLARAYRLLKLAEKQRRETGTDRIVRVRPGEYRMVGLSGKVRDVKLDADPECYCEDTDFRGRRVYCYHICVARMLDGDMSLLLQLGEWLSKSEDFQREAGIESNDEAPETAA